MKTVRSGSPTRRLLLRYFYAYRQMFFYGALFLAGVLAGAVFLKSLSPQTLETLSFLVGQFAQRRAEQTFAGTFLSSFSSTGVMLAVLFVCGFCAVSQPVIVLIPFFRGLGYGYQAGFLYVQGGLQGIGYVAVCLLPNMLLSTLILIAGCGEAFTLSTAYYYAAKGEGSRSLSLRPYCVKFMLLLFLVLLVSLMDAALTHLFGGMLLIG